MFRLTLAHRQVPKDAGLCLSSLASQASWQVPRKHISKGTLTPGKQVPSQLWEQMHESGGPQSHHEDFVLLDRLDMDQTA